MWINKKNIELQYVQSIIWPSGKSAVLNKAMVKFPLTPSSHFELLSANLMLMSKIYCLSSFALRLAIESLTLEPSEKLNSIVLYRNVAYFFVS